MFQSELALPALILVVVVVVAAATLGMCLLFPSANKRR